MVSAAKSDLKPARKHGDERTCVDQDLLDGEAGHGLIPGREVGGRDGGVLWRHSVDQDLAVGLGRAVQVPGDGGNQSTLA